MNSLLGFLNHLGGGGGKYFCEILDGMGWGGGSNAQSTSASFETRNKSQL